MHDERGARWLAAAVLASSGLAWAAMLALPEASCHCHTRAAGIPLVQLFVAQSPFAVTRSWAVMLAAMMAPMTLPGLVNVRASTLDGRRWASYLLFLLGYALPWFIAGAGIVAIQLVARWALGESFVPALLAGALAVVWQASPFKQRALNRCHRHAPLAVFGLDALRDALRSGLTQGAWCVGSCWLLMLLPMLLPEGHVVAMGLVTALTVVERWDSPATPAWRLRGGGTAARWLRARWFGPTGSPPPVAVRVGPG